MLKGIGVNMSFQNFNPFLRYIQKVVGYIPYNEMICAFDFRMFYVLKGTFDVEFSDHIKHISPGDCLVFPPGTPYKLNIDKNSKPEYYVLNFDFDSKKHTKSERVPVPSHLFSSDDIFSKFVMEPFEQVFIIHTADVLEPILKEIISYKIDLKITAKYMQSALLKKVLCHLIILDTERKTGKKQNDLIKKTKEFIQENYSNNITNDTIANKMGYHSYYLNSLFVKLEGITLHKYIGAVRLEKAKKLLSSSGEKISDIANKCGFTDSSYFTKFFIKQVGITPKDYRNLSK